MSPFRSVTTAQGWSIDMEKLRSIWVIEDDDVSRYLKQRQIQKMEVAEEVHMFEHAEVALIQLEELRKRGDTQAPELILLDLNMPRMNGWEFLKALSEGGLLAYFAQMRLAILSSEIASEDVKRALVSKSVLDYIQKPLTERTLRQVVATYKEETGPSNS